METSGLAAFLASFAASLVECVEALTVVLAIGSVRGWRAALMGSAAAIAILLAVVAALGHTLSRVPLHSMQVIAGILLLLFGLRWLRKATLRAAGIIPLHDEEAAFQKNVRSLRSRAATGSGWDGLAFAGAWNITMIEGIEVVFIVVAMGSGGPGLILPAGIGAAVALVVIVSLGAMLHRPLARVPENTLKFAVAVILTAFGTFWIGEGLRFHWPGGDWSIAGLLAAYFVGALLLAAFLRRRATAQARL